MHRLTGLSLRDSDSVFLGRGLGISAYNTPFLSNRYDLGMWEAVD